jgi:hypothetical protein
LNWKKANISLPIQSSITNYEIDFCRNLKLDIPKLIFEIIANKQLWDQTDQSEPFAVADD